MKASELRIGNYYLAVHEESESYKVVDADFIKIQHCYDIDPEADEFARGWNVEPIELNSDVLLNSCKSYEFFHDGVIIYKFGPFEYWQQSGKVWMHNGYPDYKYLHQIQNLYFALTEKEIEVRLTINKPF